MNKYTILILLFVTAFSFAQRRNENPDVQLPQFVITGEQKFNFEKETKAKPRILSVINNAFLNPVYKPEELQLQEFSAPEELEFELVDSLVYYRFHIDAEGGNVIQPQGAMVLSLPFKNSIFYTKLQLNRMAEFTDFADRTDFTTEIMLNSVQSMDASFLPAVNFRSTLSGGYHTYNFYGSANPDSSRKAMNGKISLSLENMSNEVFTYGWSASGRMLEFTDEEFSEKKITSKFFSNIHAGIVEINAMVDVMHLMIDDAYHSSESFTGYHTEAYGGLNLGNRLRVQGGISYASLDSKNTFYPQARFSLNLFNGFMLMGEYAPGVKFLSQSDLWDQNDYFVSIKERNTGIRDTGGLIKGDAYIFYDRDVVFSAALKYEFKHYFEMNGGIEYFHADNFPAFSDVSYTNVSTGFFTVSPMEVTSYSIFGNFLFHPGPMGSFYGELKIQDVQDNDGNTVPYQPFLEVFASYLLPISSSTSLETFGRYKSSVYADFSNSIDVGAYLDLGAEVTISVSENFSLKGRVHNFLNREQYLINGYKESGLHGIFGIKLKW